MNDVTLQILLRRSYSPLNYIHLRQSFPEIQPFRKATKFHRHLHWNYTHSVGTRKGSLTQKQMFSFYYIRGNQILQREKLPVNLDVIMALPIAPSISPEGNVSLQ